eukprot:364234-Chlamydomonas_euryale.AAC.3
MVLSSPVAAFLTVNDSPTKRRSTPDARSSALLWNACAEASLAPSDAEARRADMGSCEVSMRMCVERLPTPCAAAAGFSSDTARLTLPMALLLARSPPPPRPLCTRVRTQARAQALNAKRNAFCARSVAQPGGVHYAEAKLEGPRAATAGVRRDAPPVDAYVAAAAVASAASVAAAAAAAPAQRMPVGSEAEMLSPPPAKAFRSPSLPLPPAYWPAEKPRVKREYRPGALGGGGGGMKITRSRRCGAPAASAAAAGWPACQTHLTHVAPSPSFAFAGGDAQPTSEIARGARRLVDKVEHR